MKGDGKSVLRANARPLLRPHPGAEPGQQPEHRRLARPDAGGRLRVRHPAGVRRPDPRAVRGTVHARRVRVRQGLREPAHIQRHAWATSARSRTDLAASVSYTHARTDHLTRFVNRNDSGLRLAVVHGTRRDGTNGISTLTTIRGHRQVAVQRDHRRNQADRRQPLQFQANYTLSWDKSDDDNERDPFTFRYARADSLEKEYNYSDRDQRHRVNAWLLTDPAGRLLPQQPRELRTRLSPRRRPAARTISPPASGPTNPLSGSVPTGTCSSATRSGATMRIVSWDIRLSKPFYLRAARHVRGDLRGLQRDQRRQLQGSVVDRHVPQLRRHHSQRPRRAAAVPGGRALVVLAGSASTITPGGRPSGLPPMSFGRLAARRSGKALEGHGQHDAEGAVPHVDVVQN